MSQQNICKFTSSPLQESLSVSCFVLETDLKITEKKSILHHHRLLLIAQGTGILRLNEQTFPIQCGDLIFGFESEYLSMESMEDLAFLYIEFHGGRAEHLFRRFHINEFNRKFEGHNGLIPFWNESLSRVKEEAIDLAAESVLLYTFSRFSIDSNENSHLINKILKITEDHFSDPSLSISKIAKLLSYHPKYLSHLFKQKMNVTYSEHLRSVRLKHAISLFNCGLDSIKNVSLLSGFSDPLYFSNVFKKHVGDSPTEYIKRISTQLSE